MALTSGPHRLTPHHMHCMPSHAPHYIHAPLTTLYILHLHSEIHQTCTPHMHHIISCRACINYTTPHYFFKFSLFHPYQLHRYIYTLNTNLSGPISAEASISPSHLTPLHFIQHPSCFRSSLISTKLQVNLYA